MVHVGIGYDVHALVEGRKLILGGVEIAHSKGLDGHSDADALMHAICDALLGALGEVDIGHFFPNSDPRWRGAPSRIFLEEAARQTRARGGKIVNVDATLIAEEPKLFPHIQTMKFKIATALGIEPRQVGVKATTNERLGFVGREEGIAAMAVAGIDLPYTKMGAKAEISWRRVTEEGVRIQVYVQHVGGEWRFFRREKRYDQWQAIEQPELDDWLALLDSIRRRIGRGLLGPQEEPLVIKSIRERFPEAEVA